MKKLFTLLTLLVFLGGGKSWGDPVTWPDANYLLLDGKDSKKISDGNSNSYTNQVGGTGATWSINTDKYSYGNTTCTFYGNTFTKGLKHESATWTQVVTTGTATLTIVQSLNNNPNGTLDIEKTDIPTKERSDIKSFDASNLIVNTYEGTQTVDGKTYKDVKVYKLCNLPAGTYKIYRGSSPTDQTYVVYMGVTYETTPSYTISTGMNNGGSSTIEGAGSYLKGATATLTATPGVGKAFSKWSTNGGTNSVSTENPYSFTVTANATYTAVFIDAKTKGITVASNNATYGDADATATTVVEGNSTTLTATPKDEKYAFLNWTKSSDGSWSSTTNPLDIGYDDIADGDTYTANFKQLYSVTYAAGEGDFGNTTTISKTAYAGADDKITTWANNYYISKDGWTLTGWSDGVNNYGLGEEITLTGNMTLNAVFTVNSKSLTTLSSPVDVTWTFDATPYVHVEGKGITGYYVQQVTIDATKIDVPMGIVAGDGSNNGKFATSAGQVQGKRAHLTIPAVKGMKVVLNAKASSTFRLDRVKIDDVEQAASSTSVSTHTYIYTGSAPTLTMQIGDDDGNDTYLSSIKVTYPVPSETLEVGEYEWATFVSDKALDFTDSDVKAYIVTGRSDKAITKSDALTTVAANTPMLLNASKGTYVIPVAASGTDYSATNLLKAGDGSVITAVTGKTRYVLGVESEKATFLKIVGTPATVPTNKAYLEFDGEITAREFLDIDIDGVSTGIKNMKVGSEDNVYYDLQGRRVLYPTKGLYIVNGKKVIVK